MEEKVLALAVVIPVFGIVNIDQSQSGILEMNEQNWVLGSNRNLCANEREQWEKIGKTGLGWVPEEGKKLNDL